MYESKECDLEIRNINILIGSNGAGKTNFLSAFTLLNNLYAQNLDIHVAQNGMSTIFYNGFKVTEKISIKLHIGDHLREYSFLSGSNNKLINASNGYGRGGYGENGYGSQTTDRDELSFRVYHFNDTSRNARIKHEQNISNCKTLLDDASNLAAFLYRLRTNYLSSYKKILETVQLVAPFFKDFELEPNEHNNEHIVLRWRQIGCEDIFNASQLSDGTLRFICLATLLLQPQELQPDLLIIDEPELGIHPFAIMILAEIVRKVAFNKQIILSTQSIEFLNQFDTEDIIVVDRGENGSEFKRLDAERLAYWLENDYTLGELWNKNILEIRSK